MMKKLLLLLAVGVIAGDVSAQQIENGSVVKQTVHHTINTNPLPGSNKTSKEMFEAVQKMKREYRAAQKGTASGKRTYNFVEYLALINSSISQNGNFPYMWNRPDINGIYNNGTTQEADTIQFGSYATVLHPWYEGWNDQNAFPNAPFELKNYSSYTLDSVYAWGFYGRNPNKTSVVDTLRFSIVYGNGQGTSIPRYSYTGTDIYNRFSDTPVVATTLLWDSTTNTAVGDPGGFTEVVIDRYLDNTPIPDSNGAIKRVGVAANINVPAFNYVGFSVTFISGESYTPYVDTAFVGNTIDPNAPYRFGMWRPWIFEENDGQHQNYRWGDFNNGSFKFLPTSQNYPDAYVPSYAFISADWPYEYPYVDFVVSTTDAPSVGVSNVSNLINIASAYPNPANNQVAIPFEINERADVKVSFKNVAGQIIATQNFEQVMYGEATFSTSNLANGLYFYTIDVNGQSHTGRVSVAH